MEQRTGYKTAIQKTRKITMIHISFYTFSSTNFSGHLKIVKTAKSYLASINQS